METGRGSVEDNEAMSEGVYDLLYPRSQDPEKEAESLDLWYW